MPCPDTCLGTDHILNQSAIGKIGSKQMGMEYLQPGAVRWLRNAVCPCDLVNQLFTAWGSHRNHGWFVMVFSQKSFEISRWYVPFQTEGYQTKAIHYDRGLAYQAMLWELHHIGLWDCSSWGSGSHLLTLNGRWKSTNNIWGLGACSECRHSQNHTWGEFT